MQVPLAFITHRKSSTMYASSQHTPIPWSYLLRWAGRTTGALLFGGWVILVIFEWLRPAGISWTSGMFLQGAALGVVFAGYAVGWKREFAGAALAIVGAVAFMLINVYDTRMAPDYASALFALPGVLYLMAREEEKRTVPVRDEVGGGAT
jgi:hypothetical protein